MTTSVVSAHTKRAAPPRGGLRYIPTVALGMDLVLVTFSVFTAILGREKLAAGSPAHLVKDQLSVAGPVMIIGWIAIMSLFGCYRADIFGAGLDEFKRVVNSTLATAALVGIACYATRFELPRTFFILVFAVGIPALTLGRFLLRRSVHRARRRGALLHRVLIAGSEGHVDEIASVLHRENWLGYQVIGALTPQVGERTMTHSGIPLLGASDSVAQVALDVDADIIFLAGGAFDTAAHMRRLAWDLENEDVQVVIAPSVTDIASDRVSVRPVGGLPLIHLERPRSAAAARRAKRAFDIVGALVLIVLALPVLAIAALRVWRQDGGPVLTRQARIGRGGRTFRAWTLRSMFADTRGPRHAADPRLDVPLFAVDDPRVTVAGRWMRRYAIDELPQLLNVVTGDMSLVGPRAPMSHEVANLDSADRRLQVRPGLTGVWRDFRRSEMAWSEVITLDVHYAENWSMLQDLSLLFRTFSTIVTNSEKELS